MAFQSKKPKRGFAAGRYSIEKYFYERTLHQHASSPIHKKSTSTDAPSSPARQPPSTPSAFLLLLACQRPKSHKPASLPSRPCSGSLFFRAQVRRNCFYPRQLSLDVSCSSSQSRTRTCGCPLRPCTVFSLRASGISRNCLRMSLSLLLTPPSVRP